MRWKGFKTVMPLILLLVVLSSSTSLLCGFREASQAAAAEDTSDVKLTEAQKKELKQLFDQKLEIEKQIVQKYQSFGVMTKEQADRRLEHIEKKRQFMENNGYTPPKGKHIKGEGRRQD
jgi:uncharacterized lipoprotein YehR (DUF1307 family)